MPLKSAVAASSISIDVTIPVKGGRRNARSQRNGLVDAGNSARAESRASLFPPGRGPDNRNTHEASLGLGRVETEGGVQVANGVGDLSARNTHEIRIELVEIISMLMPCCESVSNIRAVTPGLDFMPAPTIETRPMLSSVGDVSGTNLVRLDRTFARRGEVRLATVKEMSVRPLAPVF